MAKASGKFGRRAPNLKVGVRHLPLIHGGDQPTRMGFIFDLRLSLNRLDERESNGKIGVLCEAIGLYPSTEPHPEVVLPKGI